MSTTPDQAFPSQSDRTSPQTNQSSGGGNRPAVGNRVTAAGILWRVFAAGVAGARGPGRGGLGPHRRETCSSSIGSTCARSASTAPRKAAIATTNCCGRGHARTARDGPSASGLGPRGKAPRATRQITSFSWRRSPDKQVAGLVEIWQDPNRAQRPTRGFLQFLVRMAGWRRATPAITSSARWSASSRSGRSSKLRPARSTAASTRPRWPTWSPTKAGGWSKATG